MTRMSVPARRVTALFIILLLSGLLYGSPADTVGTLARTRTLARPAPVSVSPRSHSNPVPPSRVLATDTTRDPAFAPSGAYPAGVRQPDPQNEVVFFVAAESFPATHNAPEGDVTWIMLAMAILVLVFRFILGAAIPRK